MTARPQITPEFIRKVELELTDQGKIIEAGWAGLKLMAYPDAPPIQLEECRNCFFAGAQHLFTSILSIMDPGDEPTEADLRRMDLIDKELTAFLQNYTLRRLPSEGSA